MYFYRIRASEFSKTQLVFKYWKPLQMALLARQVWLASNLPMLTVVRDANLSGCVLNCDRAISVTYRKLVSAIAQFIAKIRSSFCVSLSRKRTSKSTQKMHPSICTKAVVTSTYPIMKKTNWPLHNQLSNRLHRTIKCQVERMESKSWKISKNSLI